MTFRRDALERAAGREAEAFERDYQRGDLTRAEYHAALDQLAADVEQDASVTYEQDLIDDSWGW